MEYSQEDWDWKSALEILSLDFARPVYGELGLGLAHEETLRGLVRDVLLGRYSGDSVVDSSDMSAAAGFHATYKLPLLRILERALGSDAANRLEHWVRYIACTEGRNPWVLYEQIFLVWSSTLRRTGTDRFRLSVDPQRVEAELRFSDDAKRVAALLNEQRAKPLSDWDLKLFSRRGLLEIPQGSDFFPFVDAIELAVSSASFQRFWQWLLGIVSAEDLASIAAAARERAAGKRLQFWPPERLPRPFSTLV